MGRTKVRARASCICKLKRDTLYTLPRFTDEISSPLKATRGVGETRRKLAEAQTLSVCSQVRHHDTVRRILPVSGHRDRVTLLDRVHELGAEPADLRVLQPRLSRSLQEYAAVRVLLALQTRAVRSRGARFPSAVPKVRSGLTR